MNFKKGDIVQLKTPEQGRVFKGTIYKIDGRNIQVNLPNGLYVIRPETYWKLIDNKGKEDCDAEN